MAQDHRRHQQDRPARREVRQSLAHYDERRLRTETTRTSSSDTTSRQSALYGHATLVACRGRGAIGRRSKTNEQLRPMGAQFRWERVAGPPEPGRSGRPDIPDLRQPPMPGTMNMAFCDGSVQSIELRHRARGIYFFYGGRNDDGLTSTPAPTEPTSFFERRHANLAASHLRPVYVDHALPIPTRQSFDLAC